MEIKLFGKNLFSARKSKLDMLLAQPSSEKESKFLQDFYEGWNNSNPLSEYIQMVEVGAITKVKTSKQKPAKPSSKIRLTPKGVFELQMLDDKNFKLNTNEDYINKQIDTFKDKLNLINSEEYDMRRGVKEISSILSRMENRKKYPENREYFEQFPYTTTSRIKEIEKQHDNLQLGQIAQFIADLPKEATEVMKTYTENTKKVCGKQAVFYIIADKKDFKKTHERRDPILLAQSPFGHFWQILGAWDKEMLFLEEL